MAEQVVVVGGGIVGLTVALRVAERTGARVRVLDRRRDWRGASRAAGGMAAAQAEALVHGDDRHLDFAVRARQRLVEFTRELEDRTSRHVEWWPEGILIVAGSDEATRRLTDGAWRHKDRGLRVEVVTPLSLSELEPGLGPGLAGGIHLPDDRALHTWQFVQALQAAVEAAGIRVDRGVEVRRVTETAGRVTGVETTDGDQVGADAVVLATGAWFDELARPFGVEVSVRPIRGQILEIGAGSNGPRHVVFSPGVYLVPRSDSVLIGATVEDAGFDEWVTVGGVTGLGKAAIALYPSLEGRPLVAARAGLRPVSTDGAPLIGPVHAVEGLYVAAGHARNGVLTCALTADLVANAFRGIPLPAWAAFADPNRKPASAPPRGVHPPHGTHGGSEGAPPAGSPPHGHVH